MPFVSSSALRRALGLALAASAAVSFATATADAAPSPTPTPTPATSSTAAPPPLPGALTAAQEEKEAADQAVARADARIAAGTRRLHALSARADQAAGAYSAQVVARQQAAQQTQAATAARQQAQAEYDRAHARFVQLIRSSVEQTSNPVADFAYLVFTADSPGAVLDALQLGRLASENSATVVGDMDAAVQRKAAAEDAQHAALADRDRLTTKVAADKRSAEHALAAARDAVRSLRNDLAAAKRGQAAAVAALSQALGGWSLA